MTRRAIGRVIGGFLLLAAPAMAAESPAELISSYRLKHGEVRVVRDASLDRIALEQARAMAAKDNLSHEVLGSFTRRIAPARAGRAAENIAYGYESCCGMSETCPEAVVPQWSYSAIAIRRPSIALELPDEFL